jgi:hypothetical protein
MFVVPAATAVAKPAELMVAVAVLEEAQVVLPVRSAVLLSLYVPVAVSWSVAPTVIEDAVAVTAIEVRVLVGGGVVPPPLPLPPQAVMPNEASIETKRNKRGAGTAENGRVAELFMATFLRY